MANYWDSLCLRFLICKGCGMPARPAFRGQSWDLHVPLLANAFRIGLDTWYAERMPFINITIMSAALVSLDYAGVGSIVHLLRMCNSLNLKSLSVTHIILISLFWKYVFFFLSWPWPASLLGQVYKYVCIFKSKD